MVEKGLALVRPVVGECVVGPAELLGKGVGEILTVVEGREVLDVAVLLGDGVVPTNVS